MLLGSFQVLIWLFMHPSAWKNYIQNIDPQLSPAFALTQLNNQILRQRGLWQLLRNTLLIWLAVTALIVGSVAAALALPKSAISYGVILGVMSCLFIGMVLGITVSWVIGIGVGMTGGILLGIFGILVTGAGEGVSALLVFGPGWGIILGLLSGVAGYIGIAVPAQRVTLTSILRHVREFVISIAISALAVIIVSLSANYAISLDQQFGFSINLSGNTYLTSIISIIVPVGAIFSLAITWRTRLWKRGVIFGIAIGAFYGSALGIVLNAASLDNISLVLRPGFTLFQVKGEAAIYFAMVIISMLIYCLLFAITFAVIIRISGSWAGVAAGVTASLGVHIYFQLTMALYNLEQNLIITLGLVLAGVTLPIWRPILFYPFERAWDRILYQLDAEGEQTTDSFFRFHSVFWDEHQKIRIPRLNDHLVLISERYPDEAQEAMTYLIERPHQQAVQLAQLELVARQMESCQKISELGAISQKIPAGGLDSYGSNLVRRFNHISEDINAALTQTTNYHRRLLLSSILNQMEQLWRDLTISTETYTSYFRPVVRRWTQIVENHIKEIGLEIESSQEINNPYVFGLPISEKQEIFVGRAEVVARIEQHLLDIHRPPILLYGQRRMGKTSLLRNLERLFVSDIIPLFIDGQGASLSNGYADFLYNISRQMARSAGRYRDIELPDISQSDLHDSPFTTFEAWLDEIEQILDTLGSQIALIAFDEFESLQRAMRRGLFDEKDVLSFFRYIIQHRERFKILFASSHALAEYPPSWSSLLINMQTIKLGFLAEAEARALIEKPIAQFPLSYAPKAVQHALHLTRGHPHLTQLLCHELVAWKNTQPLPNRLMATYEDIECAASNALEIGYLFFDDIERNQVDELGRNILRHIATQNETSEIELAAQFGKGYQEALRLLRQRDLVEVVDQELKFQVELIRRWFLRV